MTVMRLELDPAACDGFGFCADIVPESISVDEWGFPILEGGIDQASLAAARAAVRCCPRNALRLVEAAEQSQPRPA
jgi:ferredoxin